MKTISALILLFISTATLAQETIDRKDFIAGIVEKYTVLQSDKKVRVGDFTATYKGVTIAQGIYKQGARSGVWRFFNTQGRLIQNYNYNIEKMIYLDSADNGGLKYAVENAKATDAVTLPVKIGGSCYGMLPLLYRDELNHMISNDYPGISKARLTHIILIDKNGYIVSHHVTASFNNTNKTYTLDDTRLYPDITRFTPALLNRQAVASRITAVTQWTFDSKIER